MTTGIQGNAHDTTGRFATQNRDEATVELADSEEDEPTCRICGTVAEEVEGSDDRCDDDPRHVAVLDTTREYIER